MRTAFGRDHARGVKLEFQPNRTAAPNITKEMVVTTVPRVTLPKIWDNVDMAAEGSVSTSPVVPSTLYTVVAVDVHRRYVGI